MTSPVFCVICNVRRVEEVPVEGRPSRDSLEGGEGVARFVRRGLQFGSRHEGQFLSDVEIARFNKRIQTCRKPARKFVPNR